MWSNKFTKVIVLGASVGAAAFTFVTFFSTWYLFSLHGIHFEVSFLGGADLLASLLIAPWLENTLVVLIVLSINAFYLFPKLVFRFFHGLELQYNFLEIGTFSMLFSSLAIYVIVLGTHTFPSAYFNGLYFITMQFMIFRGAHRKPSFEGFATSVVSHFTSNCLFMALGDDVITLLKTSFQSLS
jgi:hypothetical protein